MSKVVEGNRQALVARLLAQKGIVAKTDAPVRLERVSREREILGERVIEFPASFAQELYWLNEQREPGNPFYVVSMEVSLRGSVREDLIQTALNRLLARHEILRTTLHFENGELVQRVHGNVNLALRSLDLRGASESERLPRARAFAKTFSEEPFDLARDLALRAALLKMASDDTVVLLAVHHVTIDGASLRRLASEFFDVLATVEKGGEEPGSAAIQYGDFSVWHRNRVAHLRDKQLSFWKAELLDAPRTIPLPLRPDGAPTGDYIGVACTSGLSARAMSDVALVLQASAVTLYEALLTATAVVLHRWSGQRDLVIGTVHANRSTVEAEGLLGNFVNFLAVRCRIDPFGSLASALRSVREGARRAQDNIDCPFELVASSVDETRTSLYNVALLLQSFEGVARDEGSSNLSIDYRPRLLTSEDRGLAASIDLRFVAHSGADGLVLTCEFDNKRFDASLIQRLTDQIARTLGDLPKHLEEGVTSFSLADPQERRQLFDEWNATEVVWPRETTLLDEIIRAATDHGQRTAVRFERESLTYAELLVRAGRVAHRLRQLGVSTDDVVGVGCERALELPAVLLGVLLAGAAYVPLDPSYPKARLATILDESGVRVVLAQAHLFDLFPPSVVRLDVVEVTQRGDILPLKVPHRQSEALTYVIYTSGSTGTPKGGMNTLRGLSNRIAWMQRAYGLSTNDVVVQKTPFGFDVSVWEFFWPMTVGAALVVAKPEGHRDARYLRDLFEEERVTVAHFVPSMLRAFLDQDGISALSLRLVVASGEALTPDILERFFARSPARLENLYGPTEAAIDVTSWSCSVDDAHSRVPIGRPIANTRTYVLDVTLRPVPIGALGELWLAGVQLARGYRSRPDLTAERFVPDPYGDVGARMYRTGDLARFRDTGVIDYYGRADHQIKLRGFRIELGEIEEALLAVPLVASAAVVIDGEGDDARLVAFFVPAASIVVVAAIEDALRARLPEYMIPSQFHELEALPLSANGKLDRNALLLLKRARAIDHEHYIAPSQPIEELIADIWQRLLGVPRVGVRDSFLALGGHSLLGMRFVLELQGVLGVGLPLSELFAAPTIEQLAPRVIAALGQEGSGADDYPSIETDEAHQFDPFPLTDVQEAYWVGRRSDILGGNVACHVYFEVDATNLDLPRFERAWNRVIARHAMLRAIVTADGTQRVLDAVPAYSIPCTDLSKAKDADRELSDIRVRMGHEVRDASRWPLIDVRASRLSERVVRLHFSVDLLVMDGLSSVIVAREVNELYENEQLELPPLTITFRDYVLAQGRFRESAAFKRDEKFWVDRANEFPGPPALPTHKAFVQVANPRFARRSHVIAAADWETLKRTASGHGLTPSALLLGAYSWVLARFSEEPRFALALTLFNRSPFHPQIASLVGDFTSVTLLEVATQANESFVSHAKRLFLRLAVDLDHRNFSGVAFAREIARRRGAAASAIPVVFTSMLGLGGEDSASERQATSTQWDGGYSISQTPQVWLDHQVSEGEDGLFLVWDGIEEILPAEILDRMFDCYLRLLDALRCDESSWGRAMPVTPLSVDESGRRGAVNDTAAPISTALLGDLFAQGRARNEAALAIISERRSLTYGETERLALRVASLVAPVAREAGVCVGILMEKGWEQLVAALGVLKAGAAYVPLDAAMPKERLAQAIKQAGITMLLSQTSQRHLDVPEGCLRITVDDLAPLEESEAPALRRASPQDLAYVIFTSGSTGVPKGVMIDHRGAVNTILDVNRRLDLSPSDRVLGLSSFGFDLSVYDVFGLWAAGGAVVLPEASDAREPARWYELVTRYHVTIWNTVPALLQMWLESLDVAKPQPVLRAVLLSGDWIPLSLPATARERLGQPKVISLGGATEASIWSIWYPIEEVDPGWKSIPYGRAMANQTFHVLDESFAARPDGVAGDLYIGGIGLALGYIGDEEKTRASFVTPGGGERLYRTGDRGRFLPDGNIEFLGRLDLQVKVQGYRIELGEIETSLTLHQDIEQVVAVVVGERAESRRIACFYVPKGTACLEESELRAFLKSRLPDYMLPASFHNLSELPLSANGKIDRGALQRLAGSARKDVAASLPASPMEKLVGRLWCEILSLDERSLSRDANFFEIGGDSLAATRFVTRLRAASGVEIPLRLLFDHPRLDALSAVIPEPAQVDQGVRAGGAAASDAIPRISREGMLSLSLAQERVYFLEQLAQEHTAWNILLPVKMVGKLDESALQEAFRVVSTRHETLRTSLVSVGGRPCLNVSEDAPIPLSRIDIRDLSHEDRTSRLRSIVDGEARRPFDLSRAPLARCLVIRTDEAEYVTIFAMHHLVSDGWSIAVLVRDVAEAYAQATAGLRETREPLAIQYADYAAWQRHRMTPEVLAMQLDFWRQELAGAPVLDVPTDAARPPVFSGRGAAVRFRVVRDIYAPLVRLASEEGASPFMALLGAWASLLGRLAGQEDVVIGTPIANRDRAELEPLIGFLAGTLIVRIGVPPKASFREILRRTKEKVLSARNHQDIPFEQLLSEIAPRRDMARPPVFQTILVTQATSAPTVELPGLRLEKFDEGDGLVNTATHDLALYLDEEGGELAGTVRYASDLFSAETAKNIVDQFLAILTSATSQPDLAIARLRLQSEAQEARLLAQDGPRRQFPYRGCLITRFEECVLRDPARIALSVGDESRTYGALYEEAKCVAAHLVAQGVQTGDLVGVRLERSVDLIVSILGVLMAGAAYLPLDPIYPDDRVAFMLADSRATALVVKTQDGAATDMITTPFAGTVIDLRRLPSETPPSFRVRSLAPSALAYVLYTSGSTGTPKGTLVSHENVTRLFDAAVDPSLGERAFRLGPSDVFSLFHSYAFDFSVWELWGALLFGGRVVVVPQQVARSTPELFDLLDREKVTVFSQTPSAFVEFAAEDQRRDRKLGALRYVVFGGEALDVSSLGPWFGKYGDRSPSLVNMYGITETTVHVTVRPISRADADRRSSPIGEALPDLSVHVVDDHLVPTPVGVRGEIYVGGAGLSQGYLRRPELTAQRFLPDPFSPSPGSRLYRSGDLARRLSNGEFEYLGRADSQVKIRGFRIELGEIQAALEADPTISHAVVVLKLGPSGDPRLVAYVLASNRGELLSTEEISSVRHRLKSRLPQYMVPSFIVPLAAFPLTENGKLNRGALPEPDAQVGVSPTDRRMPATQLERELAALWEELLGVSGIGLDDGFFDLGGHSLLALRILARVREKHLVEVPLRALFAENLTIESLARLVEAQQVATASPDDLEALLGEIEGLSDDEVNAMLGAEDASE